MEIVDEHTHRVLAYVDALNRQGIQPDRYFVDEFGDQPDRHTRRNGGLAATTTYALLQANILGRIVPGESFTEYLARLGWVRLVAGDARIEITSLGRGLLRSLNTPNIDADANAVVEVVLDPKNPFAYAQAMNSLTTVQDALLVEPYFRIDQLQDVAELPNITRVLLGPGVKPAERKVLAFGLAALDADRRLEIRAAENLHDRYLIPAEEGTVLMLGASLGAIGKKVSTITPIGPEASQSLRATHEEIWTKAKTIEPQVAEPKQDLG